MSLLVTNAVATRFKDFQSDIAKLHAICTKLKWANSKKDTASANCFRYQVCFPLERFELQSMAIANIFLPKRATLLSSVIVKELVFIRKLGEDNNDVFNELFSKVAVITFSEYSLQISKPLYEYTEFLSLFDKNIDNDMDDKCTRHFYKLITNNMPCFNNEAIAKTLQNTQGTVYIS